MSNAEVLTVRDVKRIFTQCGVYCDRSNLTISIEMPYRILSHYLPRDQSSLQLKALLHLNPVDPTLKVPEEVSEKVLMDLEVYLTFTMIHLPEEIYEGDADTLKRLLLGRREYHRYGGISEGTPWSGEPSVIHAFWEELQVIGGFVLNRVREAQHVSKIAIDEGYGIWWQGYHCFNIVPRSQKDTPKFLAAVSIYGGSSSRGPQSMLSEEWFWIVTPCSEYGVVEDLSEPLSDTLQVVEVVLKFCRKYRKAHYYPKL
jgi:hypothetical protein